MIREDDAHSLFVMNDADSKPLQPLAPVLLQALQVGAGAG